MRRSCGRPAHLGATSERGRGAARAAAPPLLCPEDDFISRLLRAKVTSFGVLLVRLLVESKIPFSVEDYIYHLVSALCEWTVAFSFVLFFLTFISDFRGATIRITTEIHESL